MFQWISCLALALVMVIPALARADRIYGSLQYKGKAVSEGTALKMECNRKTRPDNPLVGKHGRYSIRVLGQGRCTLSLPDYTGASARVISFDRPTRYDFRLIEQAGGYALMRR